jgi:hypothetical protein
VFAVCLVRSKNVQVCVIVLAIPVWVPVGEGAHLLQRNFVYAVVLPNAP